MIIIRAEAPRCPGCNQELRESVEHILLFCEGWGAFREEVYGITIEALEKTNPPHTVSERVGTLLGGGRAADKRLQLTWLMRTARFLTRVHWVRSWILDFD